MEISLADLIFAVIVLVFVVTISMFFIYQTAKQLCEASEVKPVRYELGGLFGNVKVPIVTTPENADDYEKVCIKIGQPRFWSISDNLQYILNTTREQTP